MRLLLPRKKIPKASGEIGWLFFWPSEIGKRTLANAQMQKRRAGQGIRLLKRFFEAFAIVRDKGVGIAASERNGSKIDAV